MQVVELGGARLHVLATHPGLPGESDRVAQALKRAEPAVLLVDTDTRDALALRAAVSSGKPFEPAFVDALFAAESARRFAPAPRSGAAPSEHPLATAARVARDRRIDLIPVRPLASKPGFFERARARKAAAAAQGAEPAAFAEAFAAGLEQGGIWARADEVATAHARVLAALRDGRAPVVALVQAHRASAYAKELAATGRIPA